MQGIRMIRLIVLISALLLPVQSFGRDGIKLKYALSLYGDEKGNGLNQPEGVGCGGNQLVVADSGNARLILFNLEGGEPKGGKEIKGTQIVYPVRVKINSKGDIFVLDQRQRKIIRFSKEGVFKNYLEVSGQPMQGSIIPAGIDLDGQDNIYLLDMAGGRVLVVDSEGKFLKQVDFPKEYGFITDLAVDPKGTIFIADGIRGVLYSTGKNQAVFSPFTPVLKEDIRFASNITVDSSGTLFVSDQNGGGIAVIGHDGSLQSRQLSLGWKEGTLRYPAQSCIDKDGDLIVADRANNRIQQFTVVK